MDLSAHIGRGWVRVGGKVVELYKTVIQSFRDAADATMALFNQLDATIQNVVSWLQSLFNFKDIWNTKTALEVDGLKRQITFGPSCLLTSGIDSHHGKFRFTWRMVLASGKVFLEGIDFGELNSDGKLHRIVGFFGPLAQAIG